jgi:diadenosine tetraphosphatase ApaH/serine/threonine PP2A family protein phosphatase
MRIAFIADAHGNREAFDACLDAIGRLGVDQIVLMGDLVGYGADPVYMVERAAELVAHGAIALKGNHDAAAVSGDGSAMNQYARAAIEWTHAQLGSAERAFLDGLPMSHEDGERLYVHADASAPAAWRYVVDPLAAERSLVATKKRVTICGHVHKPAIYNEAIGKPPIAFTPVSNMPIPLLVQRRWLAVLGSCGQPRDEIPSASYAVLDLAARSICYKRAPYDIEAAAAKIHAAGLPQILAARLFVGR